MKKIFMVTMMLLGLLMFNNSVKAACAGAYVGGESICLGSSISDSNIEGTAYADSTTLVLNNYNGGSISFFNGLENSIVGNEIRLIGDNYITSENGYGILSFVTGINFVGNGTLTIRSKMPFASMDASNKSDSYFLDNNKVSTIKIMIVDSRLNIEEHNPHYNNPNTAIKEETENEMYNENNKPNTQTKEEISEEDLETKEEIQNKFKVVGIRKEEIILFASLGLSILFLIVIIILIAKNNKLKKMIIK